MKYWVKVTEMRENGVDIEGIVVYNNTKIQVRE